MLCFTPYAKPAGQPVRPGPRMALRPISAADWLVASPHYAQRMAAKHRVAAERPGVVFQAMAGSEASQEEAWDLLRDHVCQRDDFALDLATDGVQCPDGRIVYRNAHAPLESTARLVEEDLCLMEPRDGAYRLTAASVASPSYWRLSDKLGKELLDIHAPVAGLKERIGRRMRHFFQNLEVGRIYQRGNWFIHASGELFRAPEDLAPADALKLSVEELTLRCERQTLRRLPTSQAVLFTIRVYVDPLADLRQQPRLAADLLDALRDPQTLAEKTRGVAPRREALLQWLEEVGCQAEHANHRQPR